MRNFIKYIVDSWITFESFFVKVQKHPEQKRVLILRKDGLGDCLLFYPTLKNYREYYKDAHITLVFPSIFMSLGSLLSDVDEVIWFDHGKFRYNFEYRRTFILNLKKRGYDIALYPVYSQEPIVKKMLDMTHAPQKITFDNIQTTSVSELQRDIDFAEYITGKKVEVSFPTISTAKLSNSNFLEFQKKFDLNSKPYVLVFPGTSFADYRRWPNERFAAILDMLVEKKLTPVLCGSTKEKTLVDSIIKQTSDVTKNSILNLAGETDFADVAHLAQHAEFYFGSDTGILHLAAAVGTPAIGLMGSGGYERFFPYGDLTKNRALFDVQSITVARNMGILGTWMGAEKLPPGTLHPSIEAITLEQAREEINYMLEFLHLNS